MRRIGLALAIVALSTLPGHSQWTPPDHDVSKFQGFPSPEFRNGVPGIRFITSDGVEVWQPLSENTCRAAGYERRKSLRAMPDLPAYSVSDTCRQSPLIQTLMTSAVEAVSQWEQYCDWWARDYEAYRRSGRLSAGSRSGVAGSYGAQRIPDGGGAASSDAAQPQAQPSAVPSGGGAGGSEVTAFESKPAYEWKSGPEPVPTGGAGGSEAVSPQSQPSDSGGAGGSERPRVASAPATTPATQQSCDLKTFGDAQLRLLLADPKIHARLASLIAEDKAKTEQKTKTEQQNRRSKRSSDTNRRVPARSNSGMSAGTAEAIGTMIDIGTGIGIDGIGRRGTYGAGASPRRGTYDAAPRRGTLDAPLRRGTFDGPLR